MPIILPNQALVLNAYAVLVDETPGNVNLVDHIAFIEANGVATYRATLDSIFANVPTATLASTMLANLGLASVFTQAEGEAYLNANASNRVGAMLDLANALYYYSGDDAAIEAAQANYVGLVESSYDYSVLPANASGAELDSFNGTTFTLTTGYDNLSGTALDDTFNAYILNNSNTLQSGDTLSGGAGNDTLFADIGSSQAFAITPHTTSIETAIFRVQADQNDSGDNNIAGVGIIDAERMDGIQVLEDNNSRADLVIEDVRIQDNEITKDITIVMRETDPGDVDYAVYFDQNSLRNVTDSTSVMTLRVLDTYNTVLGNDPLTDSPYGSFTFWASVDGADYIKITLSSDAMQDATTFDGDDGLIAAMQAAADEALGAGAVTVSAGTAYVVTDPVTGNDATGTAILITANANVSFDTTMAGSGWLATEVVPATSGLYTDFGTASTAATDLVTSTVVLDYVGRGSMGGDLTIGGLSVGTTSDSQGVQQFDITVEDDSELQTIQSTANSLQVVNIVNGEQDRHTDAYNEYDEAGGKLVVAGSLAPAGFGAAAALPGTVLTHESYGFTDVRIINASEMTGKLEFTAQFTADAVDKYLDLVDDAANPAADNIDVVYSGGSNDDTMITVLDGDAVASNSNINVGKEDFTFMFNGNAGDDTISVSIDSALTGGTQAWYTNQVINDNITINGGAGDDTIYTPGAGDMNINGDDGNDTIYADNTGVQAAIAALTDTGAATVTSSKAVFVFNTDVQGADDATAQNLYDLVSDPRETVGSFGTTLTVTYHGLTATVDVADTTDYKLGDLEINQAIKDAVNNDAVLSKLLIAEDGPSGTLVVTSLIDGVQATTDLTVSFGVVNAADISATTLAAYNAANGTAYANAAAMVAGITANLAVIDDNYVTQTADSTAGVDIVGADSVTTSDNVIEGGAGNDVIVLGTTDDTATLVGSSNDTVVYSAAFGNDVIVNFTNAAAVGAFGDDLIDMTGLGGDITTQAALTFVAAGAVANHSIAVEAVVDDGDGVAEVGENYNEAALKLTLDAAASSFEDGTASSHVYISYNAANVASVFTVVDGAGADDTVVTLVGTIDLADTGWATMGIADFV